jgi:hypothetical protein
MRAQRRLRTAGRFRETYSVRAISEELSGLKFDGPSRSTYVVCSVEHRRLIFLDSLLSALSMDLR